MSRSTLQSSREVVLGEFPAITRSTRTLAYTAFVDTACPEPI